MNPFLGLSMVVEGETGLDGRGGDGFLEEERVDELLLLLLRLLLLLLL
jgi:hypothetical protein